MSSSLVIRLTGRATKIEEGPMDPITEHVRPRCLDRVKAC
jgi:hypothetical protein